MSLERFDLCPSIKSSATSKAEEALNPSCVFRRLQAELFDDPLPEQSG